MNRPIAAFTSLALALCLASAPLAAVASAAEEGTIVYTHESEAQFQAQLAAKKVKSVIVNKRLRTLRVTLVDGTHVLASYPKHQEPQTVQRLKADGVAVSVLAKASAEKQAKAKKPVHHKIRYIVGGAVIAVIVIVGVVLLINRRRQRD
ncbi:MAG: hypothetical protein JWM66_645 [Solirubrobacterales bacterium]|jgi:hypothetical protein|nr:hypothetical protein [Solirubrobacterales bacterium]